MPIRTFLFAIVLAVNVGGCSRSTQLADSFNKAQYRLPFEQKLIIELAAPIIILGRVIDFREIGSPKHSPGDRRIKTQLLAIDVDIEQLIKGSLPSDSITLHYFTYSSTNTVELGANRYIPRIGQRSIFFVKTERGVYRSSGDVTDFTLSVRTGSHKGEHCHNESIGCCIARLLLAPKQDFDALSFTQDLTLSVEVARLACSASYAKSMTEQLSRNADPSVAQRATSILGGFAF